jgi:WD40 repeat protein
VTVSYESSAKHGMVVLRSVPALEELRRFDFLEADGVAGGGSVAPDGRMPITVNGVLHLLDLAAGSDETVRGLPALVASVRYDPLGRYFAAQTVDPRDTLPLFDARTYRLERTFPQQTLSFALFGFAPDGNLLMGHYGNDPASGTIQLWDPATGQLLASIPKGQGMPPAFDFDSSGARMAVATGYQELGILSVPDLKIVGSPFKILTVNFPSPKFGAGDKALYNYSLAYALEHWDLSGAGLASSYTAAAGPGEIALAPDGSWFVKQSPDGNWSRWRLPGFTPMDRSSSSAGETWQPTPGVQQIGPAVSADGRFFATAHADCPRAKQAGCSGSVVIWDAATGRALGQPIRLPSPPSSTGLSQVSPIGLAFHPDLPLLAIHSDFRSVTLVTLESGSPQVHGSFSPTNTAGTLIRSVGFLPSSVAPSPTIVTIFGSTLSVWDVGGETANRLGVWQTSVSTGGFAVTPSGDVALLRASGNLDFFGYEAFLSSAEPQPRFTVPNVVPLGIAGTLRFSPDGRSLAVLRGDGKAAVWDLETQTSIGSSFALPGTRAAYVMPGGASLLVASDDMTVLWSLDTTLWAEAACKAAGRNLTRTEWQKYFPGRDYITVCSQWPSEPTRQ